MMRAPGVVRRGVELAVVRAGLEPGSGRKSSPPSSADRSVRSTSAPGRLEGLDLGVAELDEVRRVAARQRRRLPLDDAGPLLALEHHLDVGMDLVELGHRVLDHRVRRVGFTVQPEPDRAALAGARADLRRRWVGRRRRRGGLARRRGRLARRRGGPPAPSVVAGASVPSGASVPLGASVAAVSSSSSPQAATSRPAVASRASNRVGRVLFTLFSPLFSLPFCRLGPARKAPIPNDSSRVLVIGCPTPGRAPAPRRRR